MAFPRGLDYSFGRPNIADIKAKGYGFVIRYVSHEPTKNISVEETQEIHSNGLSLVLCFEDAADRALGDRRAGVDDALVAVDQANQLGFPSNRPIYFCVDFDASEAQQGAINNYFAGVHDVLGDGRIGAYGGYYVIKRLFDAGLIDFGFQTLAWSGGQEDPRTHIYQNGQQDFNGQADIDETRKDDFGQWPFNPLVGGDNKMIDLQDQTGLFKYEGDSSGSVYWKVPSNQVFEKYFPSYDIVKTVPDPSQQLQRDNETLHTEVVSLQGEIPGLQQQVDVLKAQSLTDASTIMDLRNKLAIATAINTDPPASGTNTPVLHQDVSTVFGSVLDSLRGRKTYISVAVALVAWTAHFVATGDYSSASIYSYVTSDAVIAALAALRAAVG